MPRRRLDDRIRYLCAQIAAAARNPEITEEEVASLLRDLLAAIHQKVNRVRIIASNKLLQGKDADKQDRRAA